MNLSAFSSHASLIGWTLPFGLQSNACFVSVCALSQYVWCCWCGCIHLHVVYANYVRYIQKTLASSSLYSFKLVLRGVPPCPLLIPFRYCLSFAATIFKIFLPAPDASCATLNVVCRFLNYARHCRTLAFNILVIIFVCQYLPLLFMFISSRDSYHEGGSGFYTIFLLVYLKLICDPLLKCQWESLMHVFPDITPVIFALTCLISCISGFMIFDDANNFPSSICTYIIPTVLEYSMLTDA